MSLLEVEAVNSYYGQAHILFDLSLRVEEGEVVALLGRNGSGKTTTMNTIMGVVAPRSGRVVFDGENVAGLPPYAIAARGVQLVPDTRRIVKTITVEENLELAAFSAKAPWPVERIYAMFPRLEQRKKSMGRALSGGEQQMLAIARALIRDARLLLLDEPFEGLAPLIVRDLLETTRRLASEGRTIVIVEQNVRAALMLADRCYLMSKGQIVWEGVPDALTADSQTMQQYLGV